MIVKQHLICAPRGELEEYFKDVVQVTENTDFRGVRDKFQIPTWSIKDQLDMIEKNSPKTGFVWYLIRQVLNNPDGTFNIEVGFRKEMVWVVEDERLDPYILKTINKLIQHDVNSQILEKK